MPRDKPVTSPGRTSRPSLGGQGNTTCDLGGRVLLFGQALGLAAGRTSQCLLIPIAVVGDGSLVVNVPQRLERGEVDGIRDGMDRAVGEDGLEDPRVRRAERLVTHVVIILVAPVV